MSESGDNLICMTGLVKGRVQGVFFRGETRTRANSLGISGWVRNTDEGHVEVLICGDEASVLEMQKWLLLGPPRARVEALELAPCPPVVMSGFEIRR